MRVRSNRRRAVVSGLPLCVLLANLGQVACVLEPHDGAVIADRDSPIELEGYVATADAPIEIKAFRPSSNAFEVVGTTSSGTRSRSLFRLDFFNWSASVTLGREYWTPGAAGWTARLRVEGASGDAVFETARDDWFACAGRIDVPDAHPARGLAFFNEFSRRCTAVATPELTVCTEGFRRNGSRRGPCPRRTLILLDGDGRIQDRFDLPDRTASRDLDYEIQGLRWRGDGASIVDLYEGSLSRELPPSFSTHGLTGSRFLRLTNSAGAWPERTSVDINEAVDTLGVPRPGGWEGFRSYRQYDIGECSVVVLWRTIFNRILEDADEILPDLPADLEETGALPGGIDVGLVRRGIARSSFDPVLRADLPFEPRSDAFHFFMQHTVEATVEGPFGGDRDVRLRVNTRATVGVAARGGQPSVSLEFFDVEVTDLSGDAIAALALALGLADPDEEMIAARIQAAVRPRFDDALDRLMAAQLPFPVRRIQGRPEGLEFVLAEDRNDPSYGSLNGLGLCERPKSGPAQRTGAFGALFDPPGPGDPPVFGDSR